LLDGSSGKILEDTSIGWSITDIDGQLAANLFPKLGLLSYHSTRDHLVAFPRISDKPLLRHVLDQELLVIDLAKREGHLIACPTADRYRGVRQVRFSHDGKTATVIHRDSNFAQLWDVANWLVLAVLDGHQQMVTDGIFSVDQNRIATASLDGTVKLWDAKTGGLLWTFVTLSYPQFIAFATDDRELIVGSREGIQR
jgi:WD40 repeat protein